MHQYLNREQNALRVARIKSKRLSASVVAFLCGAVAVALPFVSGASVAYTVSGLVVGFFLFIFVFIANFYPANDFYELDVDGYNEATSLAQSNDACQKLLSSWLNNGEMFLTYSDLRELTEQCAKFKLAETVSSNIVAGGADEACTSRT